MISRIFICYCSEQKREGVKIVSHTENVVKEISVHVFFSFSC